MRRRTHSALKDHQGRVKGSRTPGRRQYGSVLEHVQGSRHVFVDRVCEHPVQPLKGPWDGIDGGRR